MIILSAQRAACLVALLGLTAGALPAHAAETSSWQVVTLDGVELGDIAPTLQFADNRVTGFTGCNNLSGRADLHDGIAKFEALALTRKLCRGQPMEVERRLVELLSNTVTAYRITLDSAELLDKTGRPVMVLAPAKP